MRRKVKVALLQFGSLVKATAYAILKLIHGARAACRKCLPFEFTTEALAVETWEQKSHNYAPQILHFLQNFHS